MLPVSSAITSLLYAFLFFLSFYWGEGGGVVNIIIIYADSATIPGRFMRYWPLTDFIMNGLVLLNVVNR